MHLRVRHKLIVLGTLVILVTSSAFTWINLALAQRAIEEDLELDDDSVHLVVGRGLTAELGVVDGRCIQLGAPCGQRTKANTNGSSEQADHRPISFHCHNEL